MNKLWVDVATTPWELARVRKVFTVLFASKIVEAQSAPWETMVRSTSYNGWADLKYKTDSRMVYIPAYELEELLQSTPLARMSMPGLDHIISYWNRNEVGRRALVQILALRSWQVKHGGRLPEKLAELVPSETRATARRSVQGRTTHLATFDRRGNFCSPSASSSRSGPVPRVRNFGPPKTAGCSTAWG